MRLVVETPWASSSIVATTLVITYCENRSKYVLTLGASRICGSMPATKVGAGGGLRR
jgi:hypothetical protein